MKIPRRIKKIMRFRLTKPLIITVILICILLVAIPFLITRLFTDDENNIEEITEPSFELVETPETITVYRTNTGRSEKIEFEEYIKGVVACEMPSAFHEEALKAQAVAARTYSTAKAISSDKSGNPAAHPSAPLCDTTHCQVYKNEDELRDIKGDQWMDDGWIKICSAVEATEGELLYYDGELVKQALFHSSSGGMTENSEDVFAAAVPYLVSVESPYEDEATHQNEKTALSIDEFAYTLRNHYPSVSFGTITSDNIEILNRSDGNRVDEIQVGSAVITGRQIREALGLPSANFTIDISSDVITFTSNGSGHGVGMSQYGADGMAKEGYDYKKILSHYYSGTEIY